jgi:hypothetical protein
VRRRTVWRRPSTGPWVVAASAALVFALLGCEDYAGGLFGTWPPELADAWSQHWPSGFYVQFSYDDPSRDAGSVSVSGPGISGSIDLAYDPYDDGWNSWTPPSSSVDFGPTHPAPPLTYTFYVAYYDGGPQTVDVVVDAFMEELPTNVSPSGDVYGNVTFTWTPVGRTGVEYQVQLNDTTYGRIWDSPRRVDISSTTYDGPPLSWGQMYNYFVVASADAESFGQGSFTWYP